jgi:hypothetical protein
MATSKTNIANMALRHVGVSLTVADVDLTSDRSAQARACREFYDNARDEVLRDFNWHFARRRSALTGLAPVLSDPSSEWQYSYRLPSDLVAMRRVLNGLGVRYDTELGRIPYELSGDDSGQLLLTDYLTATGDPLVVVYTARVTDVTKYPADFAQALALLLGGYIAASITEGDELKLGERALAKYAWRIAKAWANAANEEQPDQPGDGQLVTTRN